MAAPDDTNPLLERMARAGRRAGGRPRGCARRRPAWPTRSPPAAAPLIEVTLRTPAALPAIRALAAHPSVIVGAGTVLNANQARAAHEAGARFIVAPGLDAETVTVSRALGPAGAAGCGDGDRSPGGTEPRAAHREVLSGRLDGRAACLARAGGSVPRHALHADRRRSRGRPVREYLGIASVIACGGSWLAPPELIAAADYAGITRRVATAVSIARSVRAGSASSG